MGANTSIKITYCVNTECGKCYINTKTIYAVTIYDAIKEFIDENKHCTVIKAEYI